MNLIVRIKFGSHLYGTNTAQSDLDYKGVFIPDAKDILLQRVIHTVTTKRDKAAGEKNSPGDVDEEFYALHRFMQLVTEGQTVSLDMLFASYNRDAILWSTPCWNNILRYRHRLLTKKSASFLAYCRTQANKYGIRGSRVAAVRAAAEMFAAAVDRLGPRAKLEEIAPELERFATSTEHSALVPLVTVGKIELMHFDCCNKKVPYTGTLETARLLYTRVFQDYGDRARKAAANEGIDWKALSHAVRVGRQAVDLLTTAEIRFPLPYAQHIRAIKNGERSYEAVAGEIEDLLVRVEEAAAVSTLPDTVDMAFIETVIADAYGDVVRKFA